MQSGNAQASGEYVPTKTWCLIYFQSNIVCFRFYHEGESGKVINVCILKQFKTFNIPIFESEFIQQI